MFSSSYGFIRFGQVRLFKNTQESDKDSLWNQKFRTRQGPPVHGLSVFAFS